MRSRWTLLFVPALCVGSSAWAAEVVAEKPADEAAAVEATPVEKSAVEKTTAEQAAFQKAQDIFYAHRMVISALEAEVKGDFASRERLLKEAAQLEAAPAARAHLGLINVGTKKPEWRTIDESIAAAAKDENLRRYEKVRSQSPDTAAGHLELAKWCLGRNMDEQARAHLTRLLDFLPDHAGAREVLGFVRFGDKWLSPTEIDRMQKNVAAKTNSIQMHGKTIAALIQKIQSKNAKERDTALAEFMAYKEPTAVGAVEVALNSPDEPTSKLLIDWISQVDCVESSLVLARYSLLHPNVLLREQATDQLAKRPLYDFVPELLSLLSSPISMLVQPSYTNGYFTGYRQVFGREGMSDKNVKIFSDVVQRNPIFVQRTLRPTKYDPAPNARAAARLTAQIDESVRMQAETEAMMRKLEMDRQNLYIQQVNERIAKVIAKVSGKPLTEKSEEMWKWWDEYNETEYQKYKQERYQTTTVTCTVPLYYSCSCFAAGTPVMTQAGLVAIEKIHVGDLVLNKDLETGELTWQPVLKATVRTPFPTVSVRIGDETLRCTTGHLFWVSGSGWKKANELKPGDVLHGAKVPARVTFVEAQPAIMTYNLEVADSPNYFVGKNMLLTHDVTPRESNHQTFPGQEIVRQLSEQRPVRKTASR